MACSRGVENSVGGTLEKEIDHREVEREFVEIEDTGYRDSLFGIGKVEIGLVYCVISCRGEKLNKTSLAHGIPIWGKDRLRLSGSKKQRKRKK